MICDFHLHDLAIFRWFSAFLGGVAMAMFVGRLESRRFDAPLWLIAILYFYAVAQAAWVLESVTEINRIVIIQGTMFFMFMILKIVFFSI